LSDLGTALAAFETKYDEYITARAYYEGDVDEVFAWARLRRMLERTGNRYRFNFAATPVDTVLNRLEISSVQVPTDQGLTTALNDIWMENQLDLESGDIHRWGLVFGECFVFVWPDEGDGVEITYNSPLITQVIYDVEHPRRVAYAAKRWPMGDQVRLNLYYSDRIEKYASRVGTTTPREQDYQPYADDDNGVWPVLNPYGRVPVFHFRTERPTGRPEHRNAYGPQDAINKLVITQMSTTDYHGFPQRYALAGNSASVESSDFGDDPTDVPGGQSLVSAPGELWWLRNVDSVGQFDPADVKNFLEPMKEYIRSMASTTATPLHYFDPSGDAPSGESLRTAEAPLVKKVSKRQRSFGATWSEALSFAIQVVTSRADVDVSVNWVQPASYDDLDFWQAALQRLSVGVPLRQVLTEAGYDPEAIDEWVAEAAQRAATAPVPAPTPVLPA
jgi:hypothetical protein